MCTPLSPNLYSSEDLDTNTDTYASDKFKTAEQDNGNVAW